MTTKSKLWYKSRTMWINVLVAVGGIITAIAGQLQEGGIITGLGVLNIILRYITTKPIK